MERKIASYHYKVENKGSDGDKSFHIIQDDRTDTMETMIEQEGIEEKEKELETTYCEIEVLKKVIAKKDTFVMPLPIYNAELEKKKKEVSSIMAEIEMFKKDLSQLQQDVKR